MEPEYDRKFEEMKKYIPFLESMIKRLESTSTSAGNPRQAQLDKIRSLRDLLLDKKKRMKMDNLLKCEQVLINLYAKVEPRNKTPVNVEKMDSRNSKDGADLEIVRNKLKSVVQKQNIETLPEIARASEIEENCEPGSKEPALFQRRPYMPSMSPTKRSPNKTNETKISPKSHNMRRNYTRVLVSPEPRSSRWPGSDDTPTEKPLFSRRSPRRNSPSYNKKERKKSVKERKSRKDLNITLKVPEESLDSVHTGDILTRIVNCSDGDVDIDTLRGLRSQILGELKETGSNDDISDLILKSYSNNKPNSKNINIKKLEIEEGEISDSESEAIENIYGNLGVMDKDKKSGQAKNEEKNNQQRRIQICLVVNSDKKGENKLPEIDLTESGVFENNGNSSKDTICLDSASPSPNKKKDNESLASNPDHKNEDVSLSKEQEHSEKEDMTRDENITAPLANTETNLIELQSNKTDNELHGVVSESIQKSQEFVNLKSPTKALESPSKSHKTPDKATNESNTENGITKEQITNVANFYKPLEEHGNGDETQPGTVSSKAQSALQSESLLGENIGPILPINDDSIDKKEENTEIPLLNESTVPPKAKKDVLSEIDILQALKNEILSETIPIGATEEDTPALHLPKISKVASGTESGSSALHQTSTTKTNELKKKRISIESYKKKSADVAKSLFVKKRSRAEMIKRQSLKLTEKECERFKLPARLSLDDDTDDVSDDDLLDDDNALSLDDIYGDLAPKSPDQETFVDDFDETPVLIPAEPVKPTVDDTTDVDMRSIPQSVSPPTGLTNMVVPTSNNDDAKITHKPNKAPFDTSRPLVDPRIRREPLIKDSPNPYTTNYEGTPRPSQFPNIPPLLGMTPVYTPSYAPSMTPMRTPNARSFEMTPTHQSFEVEEPKKHVYAPSFSTNDRDRDNSVASETPVWETNKSFNEDHRSRRGGRNNLRWEPPPNVAANRDSLPNFKPRNDKYHLDLRDSYSKPDPGPDFGWSDCPGTPGSSFGRQEAPMTPSNSFGRSDCPSTPSHPFGRSDCPSTPSHPFGRSDCPSTPSHPFGRSDCPTTPSHPFGRPDCPLTPSHSFGRSDAVVPRFNRRQSEYELQNDRSYNRNSSYKMLKTFESDSPRSFDSDQYFRRNDRYEKDGRYSKSHGFDSPRRFERERSVGRSDKYYYDRNYDRTRREPSLNQSSSRDESNRLYTRNWQSGFDNRYSDNFDEVGSRRDQRERSIGRTTSKAFTRAASLGRNCVEEVEYDNSSSKSRARQSFMIDTSVNATFQKFIESGKGIQVFDYSFDARRQRASSVGRSLVRENSVGRSLVHAPETKEYFKRRKNFQRASSVGRVLVEMKKDKKSFQEIKADFKSHKFTFDDTTKVVNIATQPKMIAKKTDVAESLSTDQDSEKTERNPKHDVKKPYSPRKNYRDPRMRKDQKDHRSRDDRSGSHSLDRRRSGIVYSSDNIAKGTIMGSGFGVKNYKIPKIKRTEPEPVPEPKVTEDVVKESDNLQSSTPKPDSGKKSIVGKSKGKLSNGSDEETSENKKKSALKTNSGKKSSKERKQDKKEKGNDSDDSTKIKTKPATQIDRETKKLITSDDDSEKRITRSSRRNDSFSEDNIKKSKRIRRPVIDDSDSDNEVQVETKTGKCTSSKLDDVPTKSDVTEVSTKPKEKKLSDLPIKLTSCNYSKKHSINTEPERPVTENETKNNDSLVDDASDSSIDQTIDDLEIFSDNIVSDPVIDNINDLIADLDNDIGAAKSGNNIFNEEMEKIIGDIDGNEDTTLGDISELIEKDLNESNGQMNQRLTVNDALDPKRKLLPGSQNIVIPINEPVKVQDLKSDNEESGLPPIIDKSTNPARIENKIKSNLPSNQCNDEIVSTTQGDQSNIISNKKVRIEITKDNPNNNNSTPDSTFVKKLIGADKMEESLPDSTMEIHSEISNDVTSTHDTEKRSKDGTDASSSQKEVSAIESIGSLLSILQDKTKIKELLSMLGDQSEETEKIKKKLEKLSEIVSDEEQVNKDTSKECKINQSDNFPKIHATKDCEPKASEKSGSEICELKKSVNSLEDRAAEKPDMVKEAVNDNDAKNEAKQKVYDEKDITDAKNKTLEESKDDTHQKNEQVTDKNHKQPVSEKDKANDSTDNEPNNELESNENQDDETLDDSRSVKPKRKVPKRRKKGKFMKGNKPKRGNKPTEEKKKVEAPKIQKRKRMSRELQTLQNDIKEMFMCNDVLNATGIRMCRLAKMGTKKDENDSTNENEPVVVLQKFKGLENSNEQDKKIRKKPGPKPKSKAAIEPRNKTDISKNTNSYKPGPKSKTKLNNEDPYEFDTDSVTNTTKDGDDGSSDSDSESLDSSESFGSSEALADIKKKPKKKTRGGWKAGVIKKHKKKKDQESSSHTRETSTSPLLLRKPVTIPDMNCFTDKLYCFQRNVFTYDCRLCHYSGTEIVNHYKKQHAHTEVPLSRMEPNIAAKAIQQCEEINFQAISKIPSEKYTCRFCYKEFSKNRVALEMFFWHVVSMHTGEYKHLCFECVNVTRCPFNLDIPPPPKEVKGQLIGYICGKCNFTQISLENLKTHVIVRHNDEQTEVYTINLGAMTNKAMKGLLRRSLTTEHETRTLRSSRSNVSGVEAGDERSEVTGSDLISEISSTVPKIELPDPQIDAAWKELKSTKPGQVKSNFKPGPLRSKLTFETDDLERSEHSVKVEKDEYQNETSQIDDNDSMQLGQTSDIDQTDNETVPLDQTDTETVHLDQTPPSDHTYNAPAQSDHSYNMDSTLDTSLREIDKETELRESTDVFKEPHFKLNFKESGTKEYICCINGVENHYKTTLLISLKKHVQTKHPEKWDGYCCVCKVIVTLQGVQSSYKDCLMHFLDRHMDDFPVFEKAVENLNEDSRSSLQSSIDTVERTESPKTYIAVRPLSDLISKDVENSESPGRGNDSPLPKIEQVVSLVRKTVDVPQTSPVYPTAPTEVFQPKRPFLYEEVQAEVMSKKHRIVLNTMMPKEVLVRVFKCAGRYCSFTSDSAEDALVHASAHKQLGGEGALDCSYCNFDAAGNAIDLVMHVFKEHGCCQFSCELCFYRASVDQLVGAHFGKAHNASGKPMKVLQSTFFVKPAAAETADMLSRETAVAYYICKHAYCKFRTYTPGKFCEHLQLKHVTEESHPCNLCAVRTSPQELIKHMKEHGLKLYQCTWCIHGASSEAEMLQHAASDHPTKKPQAYLRIITNKDSPTDLRVLPLIYLTKQKVPVEVVTPSKSKEDPTKEAERSIELEKLISHTTQLTESLTEKPTSPVPEAPAQIEDPPEIPTEPADSNDPQTVEAIENSLLSSPQKSVPGKPVENTDNTTPPVKNEPSDPTINQKTEILYCLDSDEEEMQQKSGTNDADTTQEVIDLSDDEATDPLAETPTLKDLMTSSPMLPTKQTFKKVPAADLYKCPKCNQCFKNGTGLKRHSTNCCLEMTTLRCPHVPCPIVLSNMTQLVNHYNTDHNLINFTKVYFCGICNTKWANLNTTKKHLREKHNILKVIITSGVSEDGVHRFTLNQEAQAIRERPKRKSSVEVIKKYGIEDVDKLPINPILDSLVYCNICEFSTKVRLNMVRHLQQHAERQPVPQTAPVNPVPHLETNEMHFDRMVNLASSSAPTRADKPTNVPTVAADVVSRYPKYVSDRQRHTCGAKGCSYISVDEAMFRIHWDTLHPDTTDYHCAHCPPYQHLNTSKPLSAQRIVAHLKMHDATLYACSSCTYYHYRPPLVEKHIADTHKGLGKVLVVREEGASPVPPSPAAPTMDLKPWQCGVCQFKSMLRAEVVEHCSKTHQTKMQFKCAYCPFRTSAVESIVKHQTNAHPSKPEDIFYYYYREGTVPNEADGTPRWQKQRQKTAIQDEVKTEPEAELTAPQQLPKPAPVNLNLVKKEVIEQSNMSVEDLCKQYGQFCDPNGIKFKCPLCKTLSEQNRDAMQSHLYEELKYRRWGCALCAYKAYHRAGLNDHMVAEHNRNFFEPTALPIDLNVEKWVFQLLNHQETIINRNIENFSKLKTVTAKPIPGPSRVVEPIKPSRLSSTVELEQAFGVLGAPKNDSYCCPKCSTLVKDEGEMRNHLESELTKIRWCCTICSDKFQTYHEAQFHCKSAHSGHTARPKEALRDPALRASWVTAVINTQKRSMKPETTVPVKENFDLAETSENSLLVVRYEEAVRPDEIASRKRPATPDSDSDEESALEIYEPEVKKVNDKKINDKKCPHCDHTTASKQKYVMKEHILRHYNLKPVTCSHCGHNNSRKQMHNHLDTVHPGLPRLSLPTKIPNCLPSEYNLKSHKKQDDNKSNEPVKVCLQCEKSVPENDIPTHRHASNSVPEFGNKSDVVVKCCICLSLRKSLVSMQAHYDEVHSDIVNMNYAFYKLQVDTREVQSCGVCKRRFTFMRDLRIHHSSMHKSFPFCHTTVPYRYEEDDHENRGKRKLEDANLPAAKRVARKSTAKLPYNYVAKKSTTKLPFVVESDSDSAEEFSYYGTKPPSFEQYSNVKTKMPLYNSIVDIDIEKLSGILKIDPKVVLTDCKKKPTQ